MGYQGINTFLYATFLCPRRFFVHREHRWGNHMGNIWGNNICRGDEFLNNFSEVLNCKKQPRNGELPATLCRSVA
jgi:hypothetical protein